MDTDDQAAKSSPSTGSITEALRSASAAVLQRHPAPNPSGDPSAAQALGQAPNSANQALPGADPVDPAIAAANRELVRKSMVAIMRCVDAGVERRLYGAALRISEDKEFAAGFVTETGLSEEETQTIGDLSATVAEKWGLSAKYAPEIALLLVVGGYGGRVWFSMRKLEQMARAKAEAIKKSQGATSHPE